VIVAGTSALVTGASRGLGAAMAVALARAGARRVFINHLGDADAAEQSAERVRACGAEAVVVEADVADPRAVDAMARAVTAHLGGAALDALVNNAGIITKPGSWDEQSDADLARTLGVDLAGVMHCTRAFAPAMREAGRGCVVNIASDNGIAGTAAIASYSAAKAGVIQYTRNMAVALAPRVRVNAIAPGVCDTDMTRAAGDEVLGYLLAKTPLKRIGRPEEIADALLFLIGNEFTTGTILVVDGGITLP
jgi:3-oxoacyl-[acyl-carrier protein] reductase